MSGKVIYHPTTIPQMILFNGKTRAIIVQEPKRIQIHIYVENIPRYSIEVEEIQFCKGESK